MEILGYIILLKLVIAYCIANYKYILKTEKDLFIQLKHKVKLYPSMELW